MKYLKTAVVAHINVGTNQKDFKGTKNNPGWLKAKKLLIIARYSLIIWLNEALSNLVQEKVSLTVAVVGME